VENNGFVCVQPKQAAVKPRNHTLVFAVAGTKVSLWTRHTASAGLLSFYHFIMVLIDIDKSDRFAALSTALVAELGIL